MCTKSEYNDNKGNSRPKYGTGIYQTAKRVPYHQKLLNDILSKSFKEQQKKWK